VNLVDVAKHPSFAAMNRSTLGGAHLQTVTSGTVEYFAALWTKGIARCWSSRGVAKRVARRDATRHGETSHERDARSIVVVRFEKNAALML